MTDGLYSRLLLLALMTAAVIYLVAVNRSQRKLLAERASEPAQDGEVEQLRERVKVLERIAVDKEHSLVREIDGLRDR